jgi:hypothetical protein
MAATSLPAERCIVGSTSGISVWTWSLPFVSLSFLSEYCRCQSPPFTCSYPGRSPISSNTLPHGICICRLRITPSTEQIVFGLTGHKPTYKTLTSKMLRTQYKHSVTYHGSLQARTKASDCGKQIRTTSNHCYDCRFSLMLSRCGCGQTPRFSLSMGSFGGGVTRSSLIRFCGQRHQREWDWCGRIS